MYIIVYLLATNSRAFIICTSEEHGPDTIPNFTYNSMINHGEGQHGLAIISDTLISIISDLRSNIN